MCIYLERSGGGGGDIGKDGGGGSIKCDFCRKKSDLNKCLHFLHGYLISEKYKKSLKC